MNIKANREFGTLETQATRVFRILEFEIVSGKISPGCRLVRRLLGQRFHVSQATVSEALWRLEFEGLAESVPLYGTRVVPLTLERVRNETVLREALECEVARLAAQNVASHDQGLLAELAAKLDDLMRQAPGYDPSGMAAHQEFHVLLARRSGSSLLVREVERLWRRHLVFFNWHSTQILPVPEHWHGRLLAAIFTGDADTAEKAMREHVRYGNAQQLEVLRTIEAAVVEKSPPVAG